MIQKEQTYASIILRLLVEGVLEPYDEEAVVWGDLLHIAAQNGVLIRVVDQLELIGFEPRHFFSAAVKDMRARNYRKLSLVSRISERCASANIEVIFPKVFQNYPDMPGDIDLYVVPHSRKYDRTILSGLRARPLKRNVRNLIDGTANYQLRGYDSLLEIHHGRVGILGEHKLYISQVIENARYVQFEGDEFLAPCPEDELILQGLQRVVQRNYLRLSDVVATVNVLKNRVINWDYVLKTVSDLNIFYGLSCYLGFVEQIYVETFEKQLLPSRLVRELVPHKFSIEFRNGFYRFQRLRVGGRGYIDKFVSALMTENWSVACRMSLLPLLAANIAYRKLRIS